MLGFGAGAQQYFSEDQSFIKRFRSSGLAKSFAVVQYLLHSKNAELYMYRLMTEEKY
jgi:hypothetical protein